MKKICLALIFLLPLLVFSQWNQIGNEINHDDSLLVGDINLNASGDIMVIEFIKFAEDYSTRTNYVQSFKLINNIWKPLGNNLNKIIANKDKGSFDKIIDYISVNDKGDIINIVTSFKKENDYYDKEIISQMYKYNGSLWEKFGKSFTLKNSYEGETFGFISNTNLLAYVTRDYDADEDIIHIYEFDNGDWIQKGKKLVIKIRQELGVNLSPNGDSIFTTSWSYNEEELKFITYTYKNEEWSIYGNPTVIKQSTKTSTNATSVKINYDGTKCLLISDDGDETVFLIAFKYNEQTNKWEQLGDNIYTEGTIDYYSLRLNNQGNLMVYSCKISGKHKLKLLEFKENQWKNISFDYYDEITDDDFNFSFSNDDNHLAINYDTKTQVFTRSTLAINKQTFGKRFKVTPNPSLGETTIMLGDVYKTANVSITNVSGKQIDTFTYSNTNTVKLNTNYTAGLYFVTIISQDKVATLKLVVK